MHDTPTSFSNRPPLLTICLHTYEHKSPASIAFPKRNISSISLSVDATMHAYGVLRDVVHRRYEEVHRFRNAIQLHITRMNVIFCTPIRKARSSLPCLFRN